MKKITIFHLVNCPYCVSAKRAAGKLQAENPAYASVEIEWKDESKITVFPSWSDYYYVPTIYVDQVKLYEAHPGDSDEVIEANVKKALEAALQG